MPSPLCHFELMTDDPDRAQKFYGAVFGWSFDNESMPGYALINAGAEPSGGMMKRPAQAPSAAFHTYFQVENVSVALHKATSNGGRVVLPATDIPHVGTMAMVADPDGVVIGLLKPQVD